MSDQICVCGHTYDEHDDQGGECLATWVDVVTAKEDPCQCIHFEVDDKDETDGDE